MRTLLWLLGLFAVAVGVVIFARDNSAYALFVWPPYRIQISMNLLILLMLAAFVAVYALFRLVSNTLALPARVAAFRARQLRERAVRALHDAERLFLEGRFGQAYRHAEAAFEAGEARGLSALVAAKAAHAMREPERRQQWLDRAMESDGDTRVARMMIETEFAIADRRFDDAASTIEQLRASGQRHIAALRLALQTEQARGRWDEVARIARQLCKHHALTGDQAAPLLRRALLEQIREAEGDLLALQRIWTAIPEEERLDVGFLTRAVPYLIGVGDERLAVAAIEAALDRDWESELAVLYGRVKSTELRDQLATAERWLKSHPDDAGLLLTLGRLCLRGQLWGKAQSYFEAALFIAPSRAAHLELAKLAESLDRRNEAQKHFRAAAELGA
ncbi:MAG TPA: heme biosynthesis HemY N-terminal domain-containing protein [Rhodocyclaceae bacterium]|nr:heme biosynthesis HemY N-terminal domain-containing protein [Rhodocyclaceae bacterium]